MTAESSGLRKRSRTQLSLSTKKVIISYCDTHPKATQQEVAQLFNNKYGFTIKRSTVGTILSNRNKLVETPALIPNAKQIRYSAYPELDRTLNIWVTDLNSKNISVSGGMIQEQAKRFAGKLKVPKEFKFSVGWLAGFKKRNRIKARNVSGESESADLLVVVEGREAIKNATQLFSMEDVYNFNETGLFFRLEPEKTLASKAVKGKKRDKERERNTKAWMTCNVFEDWINKWNNKLRKAGRNVLLLLDNASSHVIPESLSNITVHFLPANTTSHLQPLDAGIIRSFKSKYRKEQVRKYLDMLESQGDSVQAHHQRCTVLMHECMEGCHN
jgi:hypothetical protein